jgi:hypothetical protein
VKEAEEKNTNLLHLRARVLLLCSAQHGKSNAWKRLGKQHRNENAQLKRVFTRRKWCEKYSRDKRRQRRALAER